MKQNPTLSRYPLPRMLLLTLLALTILLPAQAALPAFETEVIATGLERPWDLAQLPDGSLLFTQRGGALSVLRLYIPKEVIDIPGAIFSMLPFVVTCLVLVISSIRMRRENQQPAGCGINYFREER